MITSAIERKTRHTKQNNTKDSVIIRVRVMLFKMMRIKHVLRPETMLLVKYKKKNSPRNQSAHL